MRGVNMWSAAASLAVLALAAHGAAAATLYSNGFETDTYDWANASRVASGTNGVTSAGGSYHATVDSSDSTYTRFGGYNFGAGGGVATAFQPYTTSIDIYLDVNGGAANDSRFDWDSAINDASGSFLRDFIFNGGFYNSADTTGPGAGTDRFVISAGNNSQRGSAYAKNPGHNPIAISTTGWYTIQHTFYDNGGVLAVDMSIIDSSHSLVNTWTLSNPSDLISGTGGNRYGWFDYNDFSALPFDNVSLVTAAAPVPVPAAVWGGITLLGGLGSFGGLKRLRRKPA